jgi:hypothetical protein
MGGRQEMGNLERWQVDMGCGIVYSEHRSSVSKSTNSFHPPIYSLCVSLSLQ